MSYFDILLNFIESSILLFLITSLVNRKETNIFIPASIYLFCSTTLITAINQYQGFESYLFIFDLVLIVIYLKIISNDSILKILALGTYSTLLIASIYSTLLITVSILTLGRFDYVELMLNNKIVLSILAESLFLLFSYLSIKFFNSFKDTLSNIEYIYLFILFISIRLIFVTFETLLASNLINDVNTILSIFSLVLFVLLTCTLFYRISIYRSNLLKSEFDKQLLNNQITLSKKIQNSQTELLSIRHDLKHILALMSRKDIDSINDPLLTSLVQKYTDQINDIFIPFETSNSILNNVLNIKYFEAVSKNIDIVCNINVSEKIHIGDDDLLLLLSNLLDNAITHIGKDKKIYVDINYTSVLKIKISNSTDKEDIINQPSIQQSEYHGFGIQTIKNITNKYKGDYFFEIRNKMFTAIIII